MKQFDFQTKVITEVDYAVQAIDERDAYIKLMDFLHEGKGDDIERVSEREVSESIEFVISQETDDEESSPDLVEAIEEITEEDQEPSIDDQLNIAEKLVEGKDAQSS